MKILKLAACSLAAALAAASAPLPAAAEETYVYTIQNDGSVAITCKDKSLVNAEIPAEIDGYTVSALAMDCFSECTALETVTLPETLTKLGDYAFHGCESLDSITIPAQVTEIGSFVFEGCTSLTEILVTDGNSAYVSDSGVLYTADKSMLVRYPAAKPDADYTIAPECTTIAPWGFTECSGLQTLQMSGVNAIGADAFFCSASLSEVTLSEGITELIGPTFAYCTGLKKITLPTTLETIGDKCFYGCVNLQVIELPQGLTTIGEMAFYGCVQIKEMLVPSTVKEIGEMGIGYSVDPETNENAVIKDFKMKTASGSKASSYARRNRISYSAKATAGTAAAWSAAILAVLAAGGAGFWYYRKRRHEAQAALAELARKQEEKRARRRERKNRK